LSLGPSFSPPHVFFLVESRVAPPNSSAAQSAFPGAKTLFDRELACPPPGEKWHHKRIGRIQRRRPRTDEDPQNHNIFQHTLAHGRSIRMAVPKRWPAGAATANAAVAAVTKPAFATG